MSTVGCAVQLDVLVPIFRVWPSISAPLHAEKSQLELNIHGEGAVERFTEEKLFRDRIQVCGSRHPGQSSSDAVYIGMPTAKIMAKG